MRARAAVDLAGHPSGQPAHDLGIGFALHRLDEHTQRADRRAQLVVDVLDEVAAEGVDAVAVGRVLEHGDQRARTDALHAHLDRSPRRTVQLHRLAGTGRIGRIEERGDGPGDQRVGVQVTGGPEPSLIAEPLMPVGVAHDHADRQHVEDVAQELQLRSERRRLAGGPFGRPLLLRQAGPEPVPQPNRPVMYASVLGSDGAVKRLPVRSNSTSRPVRSPVSAFTSAVRNAVRSETRAACCMLWVTITIV